MAPRPALVTLRLTSPRMEHPTVGWLQATLNASSPKYVRPPLEVDNVFGAQTGAELEEFLYRLGHPRPIPAIGPADLLSVVKWTEGEDLPLDWRARRIARMATGFRKGWGITARSWDGLHPGSVLYDPAKAADVMVGWAEDGLHEVPSGSNRVPSLIYQAKLLSVRSDVVEMGYSWCQFAAYLAGLMAGGTTAKAGLVDRAFWPLYTPYTLAFGQRREFGHSLVAPNKARKGDMVLFNFGSSDPVQHVGRLLEPPGTNVTTVDGNTSSGGSQDRGGAVLVRTRPSSTVVAYVRDI